MDDYKIAFIHGDNYIEKGLLDGQIEFCGKYDKDSLHVINLLDYAKEKFSEETIFEKLTSRHQPEVISYFLAKMGIIVFLNMTKYDEEHLRKYKKSGMFLMPDELTEKQKESLISFCSRISDFNIIINYDLTIDMGLLDSKTIMGFNHETPLELINTYFERINENKIK